LACPLSAIIPLYVIARDLHVLDHQRLLVVLYAPMNPPIAVWMQRSFLLEIPRSVIEAAWVDGAGLVRQLRSVILPIISPGLAATALIAGWAAQDKLVRGLSMGGVK
jgi:sorbitol/mannitol transport system permease protein